MKKVLQIIIVAAALLVCAFLCIGIYNKIESRHVADKNTSLLPSFSFVTTDSKPFGSADLSKTGGKVIINYFNPECEHCQYMAASFVKNAKKLEDIQLVMVTIADSASIVKFRDDYHLGVLPHIVLLRDPTLEFEKIFGSVVVPSFFSYRDSKLVKKILGETKIENLLN